MKLGKHPTTSFNLGRKRGNQLSDELRRNS
jgi:hypothetical protein